MPMHHALHSWNVVWPSPYLTLSLLFVHLNPYFWKKHNLVHLKPKLIAYLDHCNSTVLTWNSVFSVGKLLKSYRGRT